MVSEMRDSLIETVIWDIFGHLEWFKFIKADLTTKLNLI